MVQDWGSSNTYAWTPSDPGDYQFIVWVRDQHHAGTSSQDDWSYWNVGGGKSQTAGSWFTIQGVPYSVTFQESGIPGGVTWGVTVGGSRRTSSSSSQTVSGLSGSVGYVYDSSVPASGGAYVCQSGCSAVVSGAGTVTATYTFMVVQLGPPVITSFVADKVSPQAAGTTITFTATASDPDAGDQILYRFWMRRGSGSWTVVQDWSSSSTFAWTPAQTGDYQFIVWIRDGYHADASWQDDWSFWTASGGKSQTAGATFRIQ